METAGTVLASVYSAYKVIKHGREQIRSTYTLLDVLLQQFRAMEAAGTLVENQFVTEYITIARDFLAFLEAYNKRGLWSKVARQFAMQEEIAAFNQKLQVLFQLFQLSMGAHVVRHSKQQEAFMDNVTQCLRVILEGDSRTSGSFKAMPPLSSRIAACDDLCDSLSASELVQLLGSRASAAAAARRLCRLAEQDAMRDRIVKARGIEALVRLLRLRILSVSKEEDASSSLRICVMRTLSHLAVRDEYEAKIVNTGTVELLTALLTQPDREHGAGEAAEACALLANLAFQEDHKERMLATPHLIERLVDLLSGGLNDMQKKHATSALRELARSEKCAARIASVNGIPALIALLRSGTPEQCSGALGALWNLAALQSNRSEIAKIGGIDAIVEQVRSGATDEQRQLAASGLAVLAQDDANDELIGMAGGIEVLGTLFREGTQGQKHSAAWALAELANHKANATTMVRAALTPALMDAFDSGSEIQQANAGLALMWIAELAEDTATFVRDIDLDRLVRLLNGSMVQRRHAARIIASIANSTGVQIELDQSEALIPLLVELIKNYFARQPSNELSSVESTGTVADDSLSSVLTALDAIASTANRQRKVIRAGAGVALLTALEHGSPSEKKIASSLLSKLEAMLKGDAKDQKLRRCLSELSELKRSKLSVVARERDPNDQRTRLALEELWDVSSDNEAPVRLREYPDVCTAVIDVLKDSYSDVTKRSAGAVLRRLAQWEVNRQVDSGILSVYKTLIQDTSEQLQAVGVLGLAEIATFDEMRPRIVRLYGLVDCVVALFDKKSNEIVRVTAADLIASLALHKHIAVELGSVRCCLSRLLGLAMSGTRYEAKSAGLALRRLSNVPENVGMLVQLGAVDAASTFKLTRTALELLSNMTCNPVALDTMLQRGVVERCVKAIREGDDDWKQLAVRILARIYSFQGEEDARRSIQAHVQRPSADQLPQGGRADVLHRMRAVGRVDSLMDMLLELLDKQKSDGHAELVTLLTLLAADDDTCSSKIGDRLTAAVRVIRDCNEPSQAEAAAAVVVTLITCVEARVPLDHVAEAFVEWIPKHDNKQVVKSCTYELLLVLHTLENAHSTPAKLELVAAIVSLSRDTSAGESTRVAEDLVIQLLELPEFHKILRDASRTTDMIFDLGDMSRFQHKHPAGEHSTLHADKMASESTYVQAA